jgi:integrase
MTKVLLRYVHEFNDRHGKTRRYFRRLGFKRRPLPGLPGSEEFMRAYQEAVDPKQRIEIGVSRTKPGTVAALVAHYYRSAEFLSLKASTQSTYKSIIDPFRDEHGDKHVALLKRRHVKELLAAKASTPTAANNFLKRLRQLMVFALDIGMRVDDPTVGVKPFPIRSLGHPPWSAADIEAYRRTHPSGTRPRLAMELALCTMARRSDLVRMGRQHLRDGIITIRQQKTGTEAPMPVLPELQVELDQLPPHQLIFLMTDQGRGFTAAGFGNLFHDWAAEAGLPSGYNTHGLRKAGARRLAEHGASDHEIMAWGGWKSLSEVQRYTRDVNRRKLAQGALHKLTTGTVIGKPK